MKKLAFLAFAGVLSLGLGSCTNDEGDTEFDVLTPTEEQQQKAPQHQAD